MPIISIKVSGSSEVLAKLKKLGDKLTNFEPEFKELGQFLTKYYSGQAFLSRGGVYSKQWPDVKSATKNYKIKHWAGRGPLERTGDMRSSFASEASNMQLRVYNKAPYFKYHQSSAPRSRLPRRVMIGVNGVISKEIKTQINKGIERIING